MIPLLSLAWGYLDQPVPQQQLNHVTRQKTVDLLAVDRE